MPLTPKQLKEFQSRARALQATANSVSNEARVELLRIVDTHRAAINDALVGLKRQEQMNSTAAQVMRGTVRNEVDAMVKESLEVVKQAQLGAFDAGTKAGKQIADALEIGGSFFAPSAELLTIAQGYSATRIQGIGSEVLNKIDGEIARGLLGQKPPYDVMQGIDKALGRGGASGVSYRAEMIARTEINTVYSLTLDAQMEAFADQLANPEKLLKRWVAGPFRPGRREEHQEMDGETVPFNETFSNGLRFPRDPGGDPADTINCGCTWELVADSIEDAIAES